MAGKANKTTAEHFGWFKDAVNRWQKELGLTDWNIQLRHEALESALATTYANNAGAVATIALNTSWNELDIPTKERIERVALHEVIHVLLSDLSYLAECRYTSKEEIDVAEHKTVRRLEQVLARLYG